MNTWFQFKQFTIHQENTAMKVCTDACLFGAWVANKIELNEINADNILDIGCGTGLLTVMLAQKTKAQIDSVELNINAFQQSFDNVHLTPWNERIRIYHESIINFKSQKKYDLIICNPPFYEDHLKSKNIKRNEAMHSTTLSFIELAVAIKKNLSETGIAAILLPSTSVESFEKSMSAHSLFTFEKSNVSHSPQHPFFRSMLLISEGKREVGQSYLSIKNIDQSYSTEFKFFLKDYYLNF